MLRCPSRRPTIARMKRTEDRGLAEEETRPALDGLLKWLDVNGLKGYDPYDVLGHSILGSLHSLGQGRPRAFRAPHRAANELLLKYSGSGRRLLRIQPQANAKALGLLLSSHVRLAKASVERSEERAAETAVALLALGSDEHGGTGWGYPFDWYTRVAIPAGTPSAVVTSICGRALLEWADLSGDSAAHEAALSAADFLAKGLNRMTTDAGTCLSYTPLDDFAVHNASLMAASFIHDIARLTGAEDRIGLAMACLDFTLSEQRDDGAFEYWAASQRSVSHIDNYHTGFVLRSLHEFASAGTERASRALDSGWRFYASEMLPGDARERPLDALRDDSRLNIHSAAESILCPATLACRYTEAGEIAHRSARWAVENMLNEDGSFAYMWTADRVDRTAYIRWGEAWMLLALASLVTLEDEAC